MKDWKIITTKNSTVKVRQTNKSKKLYHRQAKNRKTKPYSHAKIIEQWFMYQMYRIYYVRVNTMYVVNVCIGMLTVLKYHYVDCLNNNIHITNLW